ncbi:MAG: DUF2325 domain-containing protein [Desulfobacterales bacterium]|nr:DUF2325 domain-containing protein [Desulfobacterales bacterium]MCP4161801.1 DUF2325 domain-containing protein [Deltaproteobacteria bacterium]
MKVNFKNIWEIECNFKCPVIGAMLSVDKHKSILKKCGYNVKQMKPYEYHQMIMGNLTDENNVSYKVNNFIRHHAGKFMEKITDLSDDELFKLWKDIVKNGDPGPLLYAIVAKEDTSVDILQEVYGDIHMLSHSNMTEVLEVRNKLKNMDNKLSIIKDSGAIKGDEIKRLVQQNYESIKETDALKKENQELKDKISSFDNSENTDNQLLLAEYENRIDDLKAQIKDYEQSIIVKDRAQKSLKIDNLSLINENKLVQEEMEMFLSNFNTIPPCDTEKEECKGIFCPQYQLCAKRIFMIGGMTKMKSMYKKIVEDAGGEFYYNDGYFKNRNSNIEAFVKKSDMVICPVNCNSHNACLRVKKLCNRYNKKVKFLNNSSLSTVTHALFETDQQLVN